MAEAPVQKEPVVLIEGEEDEVPPEESVDQALALNADGLRFWLNQVLLDNIKLEKEVKLSKQARQDAADLCRTGRPFLAESLAVAPSPKPAIVALQQSTKKRPKKRKALDFQAAPPANPQHQSQSAKQMLAKTQHHAAQPDPPLNGPQAAQPDPPLNDPQAAQQDPPLNEPQAAQPEPPVQAQEPDTITTNTEHAARQQRTASAALEGIVTLLPVEDSRKAMQIQAEPEVQAQQEEGLVEPPSRLPIPEPGQPALHATILEGNSLITASEIEQPVRKKTKVQPEEEITPMVTNGHMLQSDFIPL